MNKYQNKTKLQRMRALLLFFIFNVFVSVVRGQSINIDSCGFDSSRQLNNCEINYFKQNITRLKAIDISDKIFAFAYGNFGKTIITKKDFFEEWGRDYYNRNSGIFTILIELTEEEKQQSGGYDYIIISWSKMLPVGKSRKKLIERVRNYSETKS